MKPQHLVNCCDSVGHVFAVVKSNFPLAIFGDFRDFVLDLLADFRVLCDVSKGDVNEISCRKKFKVVKVEKSALKVFSHRLLNARQ